MGAKKEERGQPADNRGGEEEKGEWEGAVVAKEGGGAAMAARLIKERVSDVSGVRASGS